MKYLVLISMFLNSSPFAAIAEVNQVCSSSYLLPRLSEHLQNEPPDVEAFLKRWRDKRFKNILDSALWTLIHDYSDLKHVERVLDTVQRFFAAIDKYEKGNRSSLDRIGGIKTFKSKSVEWLNDNEQAVRAFAAAMLGVFGDRTYAPQLVHLMTKSGDKDEDVIYDRGRAAMALGMIGAREYIPNLVSLLSSSNEFDRIGAAYGLGWLAAKDQAEAVAKLLHDEDENVREAAKESLKMMGIR
jgi:hypothetical protein